MGRGGEEGGGRRGRVVDNSERCLKLRMVGVVEGEFLKECFQKHLQ